MLSSQDGGDSRPRRGPGRTRARPEGDSIIADLQSWTDAALAELAEAQNGDGGWGYLRGGQSQTEATALALMALQAFRPDAPQISPALAFLEARRLVDNSFATSTVVAQPTWTTPLAAMALAAGGLSESARAAADWLLASTVFVLNPTPTFLYGYDTTLAGWPWTVGDYSFVEPTAAAVIFLKRQGYGSHERVRTAAAMLRSRATAEGGWNYGEPQVLGNDLSPAVVPTAMALVALADEPDDLTAAAWNWLLSRRGTITSLFSLGWAAIALNVWNAMDANWTADLIGRWDAAPPSRRGPLETALCLLGVAPREGHVFAVSS